METYRQHYLDTAATTAVDERVAALVMRVMTEEFGNAGSRTHIFGADALREVNLARERVSAVVGASPDEVVFTSGATEANNLALLGLAEHGRRTGRRHIVSTAIEHKAVLEPLDYLSKQGFEVSLIAPDPAGYVCVQAVSEAVRDDTLLVSVMHANNETGALQPIEAIAAALDGRAVYFHVDAAQAFGKDVAPLRNRRIDLISISGHKVFAPKGIGALIIRRDGAKRVPISPLMFGGGQERGLRPGTLPVPLIAGLGLACELALKEEKARRAACLRIKELALQALKPLKPLVHGDPERGVLPHILSFAVPGLDSEAVIVAAKDLVAISNGSACTSAKYEPSHVLVAMGLSPDVIDGTVRLSWSHQTDAVPWEDLAARLADLLF